ncbi:hypothetical protein Bca4012_074547 [Brassica carinata]|uniref:uncharacterized protein LOC106292357 n=1 Tax=Brassica oleracea var. oleracea TaxID=109376 RepID=UPI0006A718B6|nr:PREDICTED: uncharacterized protein LOC106292357 [Brassica oleracea var. oleracea]
MKRGDEIEVSSDEEELKGSWFRAILEDPPPKSGNKKLNVSLLTNDGSSTTLKTTYRRFLRPIPPENLFTAAAEFEEGCVVEASQRGGWWTGAVVKKINDEEVWVYFDSPPDLLQFKTGQLRQHFDWVKQKWVSPENKVFVSKKSTFRCGTMVEVKVVDDVDVWIPSVIVKEMVNRKSFVVKSLKNLSWNDGEESKPNRTVGSSSIRLTPPTVTDGYLEFKHDAIRPSEETIAKLVSQNTNEANAACMQQVLEEHSREDDSRKRKRGEVEHNPDLSEAAATESVSSLTATALEQTEAGTEEFTVQPESSEEVNKNQMMKIVVLPFAKESSLWKELETREVFQRAPPQGPHFSPLVGESEVFREGQALGMMLTFSKLVESVKDLEPDRQVKALEEKRSLEGQMMALKHKILELERQQVALKEKICQMESCARDRGVELDNLES